ncbi:MAG: hypothetical protein PUJ59_00505 [Clostridiaceae bacterium]|nr:hypothetical protein [Clostridiaceae bacterium]MDY5889803.1 hypothetical protein [Oscillospiraceae bacterium]
MNRSWKKFTVIVSVMLAVIICCTAWNVALDKITGSIEPKANIPGNNYSDNSNQVNAGTNNQGVAQNGTTVTNVNGQTVTQQNGTVANNNNAVSNNSGGSNNSAQPQASTVLGYNKNQIVAYYNTCLKSSYSQPRMTDTKTEHVDVNVSGIDIGNLNWDVDQMAQNIISNNTKNNDKPTTMTFSNGRASDGTAANQFVLPTNLYGDAVQSANIQQSGSGYKIVITLKQESCSHTGTARYNASCAWPLDINVIDFGSAITIQSCTFNYPGTVLTAYVDSQGRVNNVTVEMPLTVANAQGKALGITIKVGSISGKWTCKHKMTF